MSIFRSDDPHLDFSRREAEEERWVSTLPICSECERPIQDECCYEWNGDLICEECLEYNHKKHTEDFIF